MIAPFGIAGIWQRRWREDGLPRWSMMMLTLNADGHPLMWWRFYRPGDEKRAIVIVPEDAWDAWQSARSEVEIRVFLQPFDPACMRAGADPRPVR